MIWKKIKMKNKNRIIGIFLAILLITTNAKNVFASFDFNVLDTIAWKNTILETSIMKEWEQIEAKVKKPWWETLKLYWRAWYNWKSEIEILWYHTKTSWEYKVEVFNQSWEYEKWKFTVYPWKLSTSKSKIYSSEWSVAAKIDEVEIIVELKDKYWNLIPNHKLKLLSSRFEDSYKNECKTNNNWKCVFEISSKKEWNSTFSVIDLTENKVLDQRVKVIFYTEEEKFAIWWNEYLASLLSNNDSSSLTWYTEFWAIDHFEIETSDNIDINNKENSMTISAVDEDWNIVKDYQWTIKMETNDENAILPSNGEYTFQAEDLWQKRFDLATTFTKKWKITINVYEFADWQINEYVKWTKEIEVWEEKNNNQDDNSDDNSEIKIIAPENNSKLANNQIQVTWTAVPFSSIKVYVNEKLEWENIDVNEDWIFIATIRWLEDWVNKIHVTETEWQKRSSESVEITIDTEAPKINDIQINPKWEIEIGSNYNVTIYSEPELESVKILVNWNIEQLVEKVWEKWTYESNLVAPSSKWEYSIDIVATDKMWNKETYKNQTSIIVKEAEKKVPEKIENIITIADKNNIRIKWAEPNAQNEIKEYKVFIWEKENDLDFFWNSKTNDITIENLKFDTKYYIAITTLDIEWLESTKSEIVSQKTEEEVEENNEGPWKKDDEPEHPSAENNEIKAIANDSKVTLKWNLKWENIVKYKILYWISKDDLEESITTTDGSNNWYIWDLINWLEYYFKVIWIDNTWNKTGNETKVISAIPSWKWIVSEWWHLEKNVKIDNIDEIVKNRSWQTSQTWPEIWFIMAFSLLAWDFLSRMRRKQENNN